MQNARLLPLALLAAPLAACGGGGSSPDSPVGALETAFGALRDNDLETFLETTATPEQMAELRANWQEMRDQEPTDREKQEFEQTMSMLLADGAEDTLFQMLQPQLEMAGEQWSQMVGGIPMLVGMAAGSTPAAAQAQEVAAQLAQQLAEVDVADEAKAKEAIGIVVRTAKGLEVQSIADLQALSFEQLLDRGGDVLDGVKDVLEVYGLSIDDTLDSLDFELVEESEGTAKVQVTYSIFGGPESSATIDMVELDGRWAPKE